MRKRIASARGDLTGDGAAETLILSGEQSAGSAYWQNIELTVMDGRTGGPCVGRWRTTRAMIRSWCWAA
ncbi:MAG: hypothetical protein ACLR4A_10615 [Christensenellales bacterium]